MALKFLSYERSSLLSLGIRMFDLLLYATCGVVVFYFQVGSLDFPLRYQMAILWGVLLFSPIFYSFGLYRSLRGQRLSGYAQYLFMAFIVLMTLLAASAFATKTGEYYSREWFFLWHLCALLSLLCVRIGLFHFLAAVRRRGLNHKKIIVIGCGDLVRDLVAAVRDTVWSGFEIVALFDKFNKDMTVATVEVAGMKVQSLPSSISSYIREHNIAEVWLVLSLWNREETDVVIKELNQNVIVVRYFPDICGLHLLNHAVTELFGFPVINIIASPMTGVNRLIKAIEDRVGSFIILLLISPLMLLISVTVKLSSTGPVFFKQKRVGWNGKEFEIMKFRSMPVDAEVHTGAVWTTAEDNRATKVGAFLRKTSLDELPQFINVLKGDMSIVGPRPERPVFVEQFKHEIPQYMHKHLVKAGITGWAQVNGWRGSTSLEKRIEHDLYYINHWSLWFDLKIIFLTILKGFVDKNAY